MKHSVVPEMKHLLYHEAVVAPRGRDTLLVLVDSSTLCGAPTSVRNEALLLYAALIDTVVLSS